MNQEITLHDIANKIEKLMVMATSNKAVLSITEAALYANLSESYLYKLTSTQEIPHFKPRGKMIYFNRVELEEWLQQNKVKSKS